MKLETIAEYQANSRLSLLIQAIFGCQSCGGEEGGTQHTHAINVLAFEWPNMSIFVECELQMRPGHVSRPAFDTQN